MKSYVKLQGRIFSPKKNQTRDGASLYNFSMSVSKKDKSGQFVNQYFPVTIYTKDQNFDFLLNAGAADVTVVGELSLKEGFTTNTGKEYPQELSIFGFEASMAGNAPKTTAQKPIQAPVAPVDVPTPATNASAFPDMSDETSDSVPF